MSQRALLCLVASSLLAALVGAEPPSNLPAPAVEKKVETPKSAVPPELALPPAEAMDSEKKVETPKNDAHPEPALPPAEAPTPKKTEMPTSDTLPEPALPPAEAMDPERKAETPKSDALAESALPPAEAPVADKKAETPKTDPLPAARAATTIPSAAAKDPVAPPAVMFPELISPPHKEATHEHHEHMEEEWEEVEEIRGRGRVWARAEYLLWWTQPSSYPALLTTAPTNSPRPGALDTPGTKVHFGGNLDFQDRSGARFTLGLGLDPESRFALETSGFFLGAREEHIEQSSNGNPILARPFFDVLANAPNSSLTAFPGLATGRVVIDIENFFWGTEANLVANLVRNPGFRLDVLVGFRQLALSEELDMLDVSTIVNKNVKFGGQTVTTRDFFGADNYFYGGQLGVRADWQQERWHFNLQANLALGCTQEILNIHGSTFVDTTPATTYNAGLLALATNSGRFSRSDFGVVPELAARFGFQLSDRCQAFVGYTFLYWSRVARPGDQIDLNINTNQVPTSTTFGAPGGPALPAFPFRTTDYWAQGINLGLAFRY